MCTELGTFRSCAGLRVFFHLPRIMRMAVRWAGMYCLGFWVGLPFFNIFSIYRKENLKYLILFLYTTRIMSMFFHIKKNFL